MPATATRNPPTATTKGASSTLAGLLTPTTGGGYSTSGTLAAPNGTSQFSNVHSNQYFLSDANVTKTSQPTKNTTPMTGISAGLAGRAPGKSGRGVTAGGTGPKRLVDECL
jgi:hypothetical protein